MRVNKQQSAANRQALIRAAADLFRARGIDGASVAEISEMAGLSQGALYAQFKSKDELAALALDEILQDDLADLSASTDPKSPRLGDYVDHLASPENGDALVGACLMAALSEHAPQRGHILSGAYSRNLLAVVELLKSSMSRDTSPRDSRHLGLFMLSALLGAHLLARATHEARPELSSEIVEATRDNLEATIVRHEQGAASVALMST